MLSFLASLVVVQIQDDIGLSKDATQRSKSSTTRQGSKGLVPLNVQIKLPKGVVRQDLSVERSSTTGCQDQTVGRSSTFDRQDQTVRRSSTFELQGCDGCFLRNSWSWNQSRKDTTTRYTINTQQRWVFLHTVSISNILSYYNCFLFSALQTRQAMIKQRFFGC